MYINNIFILYILNDWQKSDFDKILTTQKDKQMNN